MTWILRKHDRISINRHSFERFIAAKPNAGGRKARPYENLITVWSRGGVYPMPVRLKN